MSETTQSPARLVRKKAARLNYVPLIMAGGVLAAFAGVIGYTAIERANRQQKAAAAAETPSASPAQVPDFIAARAAEDPPPPPTAGKSIAEPAPAMVQAGAQMDDPRVKAWQSYYQQLEQLQQAKSEAASKAMTAGTDAEGQGGGKGLGVPDGGNLSVTSALGGTTTAGTGSNGDTGALPTAGTDAGAQAEKRAFLGRRSDTTGANEDLAATLHGPKPDTIMEGTAIQAVMMGGMNSDMPGMVVGRVIASVYDSKTGQTLLIPQNSKLIGKYDDSVSNGQTRIGVVWNRIIFPDTTSIQIGSMEGADEGGYAGFHDLVDRHFWEKFGNAVLISIAGAGVQLSQPQAVNGQNFNSTQLVAGSMGQQFSELGQEYARAGMTIPNTLEVRPGYRFVVMVNKDIHLPPFADHRDVQVQSASVGPVMQ